MINEEKAKKIVLSKPFNDASSQDYAYKCAIEMAKWKDEELKKDFIELEAKNDVLESCLRDAKGEIERLRHRIEVENTYRMQIENAVRSLPNSVKDLIKAFNMII